MRHNPGYGIMAEFVQRRPVIVDLLRECGLRRHLHIIERRDIEGLRPADAKICAGCGNQCFGIFERLAIGKRRGRSGHPFR
jgi:hypothetical protein